MLNEQELTRSCDAPVYTVAISNDASRFLWAGGSPGDDCSISVCDAASGEVLYALRSHECPVVRARFLSDGSIVSFSFDSHICRWSSTGELILSNNIDLAHRADGFAISQDETLAVVGDYRGEISGYRLSDGTQSFAFKENSDQIWSLALAPDNKRLLSGGSGGVIRAWNLSQQSQAFEVNLGRGQHIRALASHPKKDIFAAAIAPDGLAAEGSKSRIAIFSTSTGTEVKTIGIDAHQKRCSFSPDGHLLAAAGGGTDRDALESEANYVIHVWDIESGDEVATLSGHTGLVRDLAFTPDSKRLLSAGWDETVRVWHLGLPESRRG